MNQELVIENYNTEKFKNFYSQNKDRIQKALKGRRMKKRHLMNAKKLLGPVLEIPEVMHPDLIVEAIRETVDHAEDDGFEGSEFDHFGFAKRLRQKVQNVARKTVEKKGFDKLRSKLQKKRTQVPQSVPVGGIPIATARSAAPIANEKPINPIPFKEVEKTPNAQVAASSIAAPIASGSGGGSIMEEEADNVEPIAEQTTSSAENAISNNQVPLPDPSNSVAKKDKDNPSDEKSNEQQDKIDWKKWMLIGGGAIGLIAAIVLTMYLLKSKTNP